MKLYTFTILFAATIGLATCKKNNLPIVDMPIDPVDTIISPPVDTSNTLPLGKVEVLKNGVAWDVPFRALNFYSDSAFMASGRILYSNKVSHSFVMNDIPCKIGNYRFEFWPIPPSLKPNQVPHTGLSMFFEGDQPVGFFYLDTLRSDHFVEVTRYDSTSRTVEGRFQVFLRIDSPTTFPNIPDTISLTEGRFHLKIE